MVLSDLSIKRPVLATVMSLTIILIGMMAYNRLTVREYPNIDAPTVSVRTVYLGASSSIMESQVTLPLEDQLSGIDGIDTRMLTRVPNKFVGNGLVRATSTPVARFTPKPATMESRAISLLR